MTICIAVASAGCGNNDTMIQKSDSLTVENDKNETPQDDSDYDTFPVRLELSLTDTVSVDAECIFPDSCIHGTAEQVRSTSDTLWNHKNKIVDYFWKEKKPDKEYNEKYENQEIVTYLQEDQGLSLSVASNGYLTWYSPQASFVQNVLFSDERFDDYNGDKYLQLEDLPFMTQEEARKEVASFLEQLGVEVSDETICYVMDHDTMQDEEARIYSGTPDLKPVNIKEIWTEADDCYCFMTSTACDGYRVIPPFTGEGTDDYNVTVLLDRTGVIFTGIQGYYPLEKAEEVQIKGPEAAAEKAAQLLGDIISDNTYLIKKIALCQKVLEYDASRQMGRIVPVWECTVLVRPEEGEEYTEKLLFKAETLEGIR